jgi:Holliday junction resolvase
LPTNYARGYFAETKAVEELQHRGYTAWRSAGSHSPTDVIAISSSKVLLVQVKRTKLKNYYAVARKAAKELLSLGIVPSCVELEIWVWQDGNGWVVQTSAERASRLGGRVEKSI